MSQRKSEWKFYCCILGQCQPFHDCGIGLPQRLNWAACSGKALSSPGILFTSLSVPETMWFPAWSMTGESGQLRLCKETCCDGELLGQRPSLWRPCFLSQIPHGKKEACGFHSRLTTESTKGVLWDTQLLFCPLPGQRDFLVLSLVRFTSFPAASSAVC